MTSEMYFTSRSVTYILNFHRVYKQSKLFLEIKMNFNNFDLFQKYETKDNYYKLKIVN